jgi:hypothetical protein
MGSNGSRHRVDGVLNFFSSRPNWASPTPSLAGECVRPPPLWFLGGTLACGRWGGGVPIRTSEGTDCTLGIYVLCGSRTWLKINFTYFYDLVNICQCA